MNNLAIPKEICWFTTFTGRKINPERFEPYEVNILDIAKGLSNICRFSGQIPRFYSVAEHSINVCAYVEHIDGASEATKIAALLHDASEAYIADIPTPFKNLLPEYKVLEKKVQDAILRKFCLEGSEINWDLIKEADQHAYETERNLIRIRAIPVSNPEEAFSAFLEYAAFYNLV